MQINPEEVERQIVPRWRQLARTPHAELSFRQSSAEKKDSDTILEAESRWRADPTLPNAVELLSAAALFGPTRSSFNAARFILNSEAATSQVSDLASHHIGERKMNIGPDVTPDAESLRERLHTLRLTLSDQPRNSILHVEAARIYTSLGQDQPATKSFEKALAAGESNRFILRSAVRFFVHRHDFARAHAVLKHVPESDPWLMAAVLSSAELAGIKDRRTRRSTDLLLDDDPSQITDLAAGLATLEMKHGSRKRAKRLISLSAQSPTDNAVAQIRWLGKQLNLHFDDRLLGVDLTYEARFEHAVSSQKWDDALQNCVYWLRDEPFSARPAVEGCFIASEMKEDWETAKSFATLGLRANEFEPQLLNNLALAEAALGNHDTASELIDLASAKLDGQERSIYTSATRGFLAYARGDYLAGSQFYAEAINDAKAKKLAELAQRAALHWMREEIRIGNRPYPQLWDQTQKLISDPTKSTQMARDFLNFVMRPAMNAPLTTQKSLHSTMNAFDHRNLLLE